MLDITLPELMKVTPVSGRDLFAGKTHSYGRLGIYGGHFLGQALSAGLATVDEPKVAQSFHAYFLQAGDPSLSLAYQVQRLREGRNSEVRSITALQGESAVFHMVAAFKHPESGEEHQKSAPVVPSAVEVIAARQAAGKGPFPFPVVEGGRVEMEFITESFMPDEFSKGREPFLRTWMRVPGCDGIDVRSRQSVLAFLSDGTLMFNSVLPYGIPFMTHRLTSLDQSAWFHRDTDPGEWMLYDQRSTAAADGRGLNEGEIYDPRGLLIMSTAQESMLRPIPGTNHQAAKGR